MAYGGVFPVNYQQMYYPQQAQMPGAQMSLANQPQPQSGIIWVQGEAGAKSYLVAPNTTVQLWDSEAQVIYLKSADASGMPSFKILDYTIRDAKQPIQTTVVESNEYVTKKDFDGLAEELSVLKKRLNDMSRRSREGDKQ